MKWCTNNFTYNECLYLTNILYELYTIKCSIHETGKENQYVIYVLKESMPTLRNLIKDFIVPSMLYKIEE